MSGTKEYLDDFSSVTFEEKPFCDGDAIAFCEITYLPFEKVVSPSFDDEPVDFVRTSNRLYFSDEHNLSKIGLFISHDLGKRLMVMADGKRYAGMKIAAFRRFYNTNPAVQFAAGTFILPDGTLVVSFQGTDDTLAGWKEDLDFFVHRQSPAYEYALTYINELAEKFSDGEIILLGHSKGGHEALYTALKCSPEIRSRIKYLYNNDGPGFYDRSFFRTGAYDELLEKGCYRHYVPSSSFIGMLMSHDYDYKAIKSTKHVGMLQHDMETWQFENGDLITVPDTDAVSKVTDVFLAKLIGRTDDNSLSALDRVMTDIISGTGQETLTGLSKNAVSAVKGVKKAWDNIEPDVKTAFKGAFSGSGKLIKESINTVKEKGNSIKEDVRKVIELAEAK